jgi:hypothetical protein
MLQEVREIALSAATRITESIKWSTSTFSDNRYVLCFNPAKKFVSLLSTPEPTSSAAIPAWKRHRHRSGDAILRSGRGGAAAADLTRIGKSRRPASCLVGLHNRGPWVSSAQVIDLRAWGTEL